MRLLVPRGGAAGGIQGRQAAAGQLPGIMLPWQAPPSKFKQAMEGPNQIA